MYLLLKKLIFLLSINCILFIFLIVCSQNSSNQSKVNFIFKESVELPIGFIAGSSFILGSLAGSIFLLNYERN